MNETIDQQLVRFDLEARCPKAACWSCWQYGVLKAMSGESTVASARKWYEVIHHESHVLDSQPVILRTRP